MSQDTQLGHATGSGKKNAVELDLCFTYYFPLLQGFGWKTSSVFLHLPVLTSGISECRAMSGYPECFRWGSGGRGDDFWRELTQLDGQSFSTYGDYIFDNYPFQGTCFFMIFGVGMTSYIYTHLPRGVN